MESSIIRKPIYSALQRHLIRLNNYAVEMCETAQYIKKGWKRNFQSGSIKILIL